MVERKRKSDPFCRQIEEIIFTHLNRLERIQPNESVGRVQSYLGGLDISLYDSSEEMKTLSLELGNQSSTLFIFKTDEFLRDLSPICGDKINSVVIVETNTDVRNKEQCLTVVEISFGEKSLAEWIKGNGAGLCFDITTRKVDPAGVESTITKVLHITRQADGSSTLGIELPELVDLFDRAMQKNFNDSLIRWLHDEMNICNVTMEAHQESFRSILDRFIVRIVQSKFRKCGDAE